MSIITVRRGDHRSHEEILNAGGFIPIYLLQEHVGAFKGFLACTEKKERVPGCAHLLPHELLDKARLQAREILKNPTLVQEHVMFNKRGYLATACCGDEYSGHVYEITASFPFNCAFPDVKHALPQETVGTVPPILKDSRMLMNANSIDEATDIAFMTHKGIELAFITPIPAERIKYVETR